MSDSDKLRELAQLTFRPQAGQDLLAELKATFIDRNCYVRGDTHDTAYKLGTSHAVQLLINLTNEDSNG